MRERDLFDDPDVLPDICRNNHGGNSKSEEANRRVHPRKERMRARMYAFVFGRGAYGCTCDEACEALDIINQSGSARWSELTRDGDILDTGETRLTHRGRSPAAVMVARGVLTAQEALGHG